jgi:RNA recognition motif-containing protein
MDNKLYVGNLPFSTTEEDLRTMFAQAGTVVSVSLIKDRDTGRSRGFAFVELSTQAEAEKAVSLFNKGRHWKVQAVGWQQALLKHLSDNNILPTSWQGYPCLIWINLVIGPHDKYHRHQA